MKKKGVVFFLLLALLCVGGTELAASSHFAPALYQAVTAPARRGAELTVELAVELRDRAEAEATALWEDLEAQGQALAQQWEERRERERELAELDDQLVDQPAPSDSPPVSDPSITELTQVGEGWVLTGGVVPVTYFNQLDPAWADQPYGSDDIGRYGCGPVAMAMVVGSLTDQEVDPRQMAQLAVERGYWAKGHGSYLSIVTGLAEAYGLEAQSVEDPTPERLEEELLSGKLLVALVGPGHFTKRGHFILLRGVTLSGDILVADPSSSERSLTEWDPQLILDELSSSTSNGAPLWAVSVPS
jgi:hypothetical protein